MLVTPRNPAALIECARDGHARGDNRRMVLRNCYGVVFPEEFFVLLEDDFGDGSVGPLVWRLARPEVIQRAEHRWLEDDERVYALDRELVRLDEHSQDILCYRLDELAAGRTTVFTLSREFDQYAEARPVADALLAHMVDLARDQVRRDEAEYSSPSNRGAGSIDLAEVEGSRKWLRHLEELQRQLEERLAAKQR